MGIDSHTRGWRVPLALLMALVLALGTAACGDDEGSAGSAGAATTGSGSGDSAVAGQTVKVGYIGPQTGPLAASGVGGLNGAKAGVEYLNNGGGVAGVKYELSVRDDKGDPTAAAAAARELAGEGVKMIMPNATTGSGLAVQPVVNQSKMLFISANNLDIAAEMKPDGKYPWTFGTGPGFVQFAEKQIEYAKNVLGAKKLGQIYSADPGGKFFVASAEPAAKAAGIELISQSFAPTQADVTAQLTKIKDAGADALAVWTYGTPLVNVAQSLSKMGWSPPIVTVLGSADPAVKDLLERQSPDALAHMVGGPIARNFTVDQDGAPPKSELGKAYVESMKSVTGEQQLNGNDLVGVYMFDALIALDRGIKAADSVDTSAIAEAFSKAPIEISQGMTAWPTDRATGVSSDDIGLMKTDSDFSNGTGLAADAK